MDRKMKVTGILAAFATLLTISAHCLAAGEAQTKDPGERQERTYFFQHRLIPEWTHRTRGAFFDDLNADRLERLIEAASKVVSPEFAAAITVRKYPEARGVLISFPAPAAPPECYYIYIHRVGDGATFSLFTYEKTLDLLERGHKGVVGSWSADKAHGNLGPRTYDDPDSFVRDVQNTVKR